MREIPENRGLSPINSPNQFDPKAVSNTLEGLSATLLELLVQELNLDTPPDPAVQTRLISLADAVHTYAKLLADYLDK